MLSCTFQLLVAEIQRVCSYIYVHVHTDMIQRVNCIYKSITSAQILDVDEPPSNGEENQLGKRSVVIIVFVDLTFLENGGET